jgi:hypothetical protein
VIRAAYLLALLVVALVGCGSPPADLFLAHRTGSVPGAKLDMLVSDGSVRCNDGPAREISSQQVLEGRAIAAALQGVKQSDIPPAKPVIFGFSVRSEWGTIHFADTDQRPEVLPRITRLVRDLAIGVCHLPR